MMLSVLHVPFSREDTIVHVHSSPSATFWTKEESILHCTYKQREMLLHSSCQCIPFFLLLLFFFFFFFTQWFRKRLYDIDDHSVSLPLRSDRLIWPSNLGALCDGLNPLRLGQFTFLAKYICASRTLFCCWWWW